MRLLPRLAAEEPPLHRGCPPGAASVGGEIGVPGGGSPPPRASRQANEPAPLRVGAAPHAVGSPGVEANRSERVPEPILARLDAEVVRIVRQTEVPERLRGLGLSPTGKGAAVPAEEMEGDLAFWGAPVRERASGWREAERQRLEPFASGP